VENARGCVAALAFWFLLAVVLIGWVMMVIIPVLGGGPPIANLGLLVFWTAASAIVARLAGGPGWGLKANGGPSSEPAKPILSALLPRDWANELEKKGFDSAKLRHKLDRLYDAAHSGAVLPPRNLVFRAFTLTPLSAVKVVIVGMDPYPKSGRADGLAFSVKPGRSIPHSLGRVFANLSADTAARFVTPSQGDLTAWASQGVLLLNAALTVCEGIPGSHQRDWASFTQAALEIVNESAQPTVFLMWGDHANALADAVPIDESKHLVIRSTHPRREESSVYPRFASTRPFSQANRFLFSRGRREVDWRLA
jgi:uracil-DNA glycosylase